MIRDGARRIESGTGGGLISVTAGSPAHTKGAWVEQISALDFNATGLYIHTRKNGISSFLFDVGIGGAGSEKVVVPNIFSARGASAFYVPIRIPAGVRIAARCQADGASQQQPIQVKAMAGDFLDWLQGSSRVVDYGTNLAASRGILLQTSLFSTKTAWTEVTPATTNPIRYLIVFHQAGDGGNSAWRLDIGIGGAGSEKVLVPDIVVQAISGAPALYTEPPVTAFPCSIPVGTRLAIRYQVSNPFFGTRDDLIVSLLGVG